MKTLTWADFAKHKPCYNPSYMYGEWEGTILDLMQRPDIPANDKLWAFTREGITDDKTLRLFAVACAKRVQHLLKDQQSINAIDVERYANGNATENMSAVARYAVGYAARAAAGASAGASAGGAAWGVEKQAQVEIAIELLTKLK